MGGCASKPREVDVDGPAPQAAQAEAPVAAEAVTEQSQNKADDKKEISKEETPSAEEVISEKKTEDEPSTAAVDVNVDVDGEKPAEQISEVKAADQVAEEEEIKEISNATETAADVDGEKPAEQISEVKAADQVAEEEEEIKEISNATEAAKISESQI